MNSRTPDSSNSTSDFPGEEYPDMSPLSKRIITRVLNLYNSKAKPSDFEIYNEKAVFEDPLLKANGMSQIKSAFYSLPKIFKSSKVVEYTAEDKLDTNGNGEIILHNTQHYVFMKSSFDTISLIKLEVKDGKVVSHLDLWNKKPLLGKGMGFFRKANMMLTHALMEFGADPKAN